MKLCLAANALGYGTQFRGTRATPGDPNALMSKSPEELDAALAEAVRASAADGAKAVIIGGGPLTASALRLQPKFDIPLVKRKWPALGRDCQLDKFRTTCHTAGRMFG